MTVAVPTDPTQVPPPRNRLERRAVGWLRDPRDIAFVRVIARISVAIPPLAFVLFLLPSWLVGLLAVPWLVYVFAGFAGPYVLMLHAMCHRPTFIKELRWMERIVPWALGPFFGSTPTSFFVHHMGMHHPENNLMSDASSTLCYQRDRPSHFVHYWARFFFFGVPHMVRYLRQRGRDKLIRRLLLGEVAWLVGVGILFALNPVATLVVFVAPLLLLRTLMMCGNWAQHAFVDLDDPDNPYRNSTNLTNARYNHKCYNDGYHIVHHLYPSIHWTEMPGRYLRDTDEYAKQGALVFDGVGNNQAVFWLLMRQRYDKLADKLVRFEGDHRTQEEVIADLQARVRRSVGPVRGLLDFSWEADWEAPRKERKARLRAARQGLRPVG